jgi:DNA polymerase III epsilon subunit-like protein
MEQCDFIVAHNAQFDRAWIEVFPTLAEISKRKKWLCTRKDFSWPGFGSLKLESIASRMGVPYVYAHRSLPDVLIMLECLRRLPGLTNQIERVVSLKFPDELEKVG